MAAHDAGANEAGDPLTVNWVEHWLRSHGEEAYFVPELEVQARRALGEAPAVRAAVGELERQGKVRVLRPAWGDPHVPASALELVTWAEGEDPARVVERLERQWAHWLRAFLATHRCS
ncbi:MAG: hypothetical protein K6U87_05310 [Firmicutes bacterium]|nr:hypothetical protein [Bacillota bacterium]